MNPLALRWLAFRVMSYGWPQRIFMGLISLVLVSGVALTALAASLEDLQYREALAKGGNVLIVAGDGEVIDSSICENLSRRSDVEASGAWSHGGVVHALSAPGIGFQSARVSSGYLAVAAPDYRLSAKTGVTLGSAAAVDLGAKEGALIRFRELGELPVGAIVDVTSRSEDKTRWVLTVTHPTFKAEECWLESVEGNREAVGNTLAAVFPSLGIQVNYLRDSSPEDAVDVSLTKIREVTPWATATLSSIFVLLGSRFERGTRTLLQVSGMSRGEFLIYGVWRGAFTSSIGIAVAALCLIAIYLAGLISSVGVTHGVATIPLVYASIMIMTAFGSVPTFGNAIVRLRD